jgi:hypothetical protein
VQFPFHVLNLPLLAIQFLCMLGADVRQLHLHHTSNLRVGRGSLCFLHRLFQRLNLSARKLKVVSQVCHHAVLCQELLAHGGVVALQALQFALLRQLLRLGASLKLGCAPGDLLLEACNVGLQACHLIQPGRPTSVVSPRRG